MAHVRVVFLALRREVFDLCKSLGVVEGAVQVVDFEHVDLEGEFWVGAGCVFEVCEKVFGGSEVVAGGWIVNVALGEKKGKMGTVAVLS